MYGENVWVAEGGAGGIAGAAARSATVLLWSAVDQGGVIYNVRRGAAETTEGWLTDTQPACLVITLN